MHSHTKPLHIADKYFLPQFQNILKVFRDQTMPWYKSCINWKNICGIQVKYHNFTFIQSHPLYEYSTVLSRLPETIVRKCEKLVNLSVAWAWRWWTSDWQRSNEVMTCRLTSCRTSSTLQKTWPMNITRWRTFWMTLWPYLLQVESSFLFDLKSWATSKIFFKYCF